MLAVQDVVNTRRVDRLCGEKNAFALAGAARSGQVAPPDQGRSDPAEGEDVRDQDSSRTAAEHGQHGACRPPRQLSRPETPRSRFSRTSVQTGRDGRLGRDRVDDELAAALVISPATVRTHVSRAMIKLAARDPA